MNKLEKTILKENYEELQSRIFNLNKYLEELNLVINMNNQLVDEIKFNEKQLEIFKSLKTKFLESDYMPFKKNLVENNLNKIKLVIDTVEEKK